MDHTLVAQVYIAQIRSTVQPITSVITLVTLFFSDLRVDVIRTNNQKVLFTVVYSLITAKSEGKICLLEK